MWVFVPDVDEIVSLRMRFEMNWQAETRLVEGALSAESMQFVRVRVWPLFIHYPYAPGSNKYKYEPLAITLVATVLNLITIF